MNAFYYKQNFYESDLGGLMLVDVLSLTVHVCCRLMRSWQRRYLWGVFATQPSLRLVHAGGKVWKNDVAKSITVIIWRFEPVDFFFSHCILSEFHRLVFSQRKMWHTGHPPRKRMCQEPAGVPCFRRPGPAGSTARKEHGQQHSDLATENGTEAAAW